MSFTEENGRADILRLTHAAVEAAELGRWDAVAHYYQERGAILEAMPTPIRGASELLKLDERIRDRVRTAQAVVMSRLGEAAATRQRLQSLHQRLGAQSSAPVTVSMKV